jgi:hypothetical protein
MKNFKWNRVILLMLAVAISVALVACGGETNTTEEAVGNSTMMIEAISLLDHADHSNAEKVELLPSDGVIFEDADVPIYEGDTAYDLLTRITKDNEIQMESEELAGLDSVYVMGLANIYEGDCGEMSGWTFTVNGEFSMEAAPQYVVSDGDEIVWSFACYDGIDFE